MTLLGFTGFNKVLLGFIGLYLILSIGTFNVTWFYFLLLSITELYDVSMGLTELT